MLHPEVLARVQRLVPNSHQLFFNIQQAVVLCHTFATTRTSRLQVSSAQPDGQIGNEVVSRFSRAMRHKNRPAVTVRLFCCINRFSDSTDLVDLEQQSVAGFFLMGLLNAPPVRREEIIADQLDGAICIERCPSRPVVLPEWVLQQYDRVLFKDLIVQLRQSFSVKIDTLL